ncbi:MAG: CUAEP/CCAEP-tail radical SAM protein [Acidobacteriota bacterium]
MHALLISTYELGRQPFGLASPTAWLRHAGWDVTCIDLAKQRLPDDLAATASLIGFHLPMHTATRLAGPVIDRVRRLAPAARICAYGLYAPLNGGWLRSIGVDDVLGGEFEEDLTAIAAALASTDQVADENRGRPPVPTAATKKGDGSLSVGTPAVPRLHFLVPDRTGLLPLDRYATLQMPDGSRRVVGSTEASRGCKHLCRHCPIVPVYEGQFRIVPVEVVLADVAAQVARGAAHITFGDPDFFNGPAHAMRIVDGLHAAHPEVSYDVTIKIEHVLKHRDLLPRLRDTGCLFVTSAVESVDDRALTHLRKGHTRLDFIEAATLSRSIGLTLVPTFVAFHPWLTLAGYCDLLETIAALELVDHVPSIQLAIRLLIPAGSKLLEIEEIRGLVAGFDPATLAYGWAHPDSRVDDLQKEIAALVGVRIASDRRALFEEISALAYDRAGIARRTADMPGAAQRVVPYLSEPWYCCAEPNPDDMRII